MTQHTLDSFRCISRFLQKRQGLSFAQLLFLLELAMVETALTFPVLSRLLGMSTAALIGLVDRAGQGRAGGVWTYPGRPAAAAGYPDRKGKGAGGGVCCGV